jgi:hypothetical protein
LFFHLRIEVADVEEGIDVHREDAGDVLGALDVAAHPEGGFRHARQ